MTTPPTPAGWYPDPDGSGGQRYWDGATWTEHRAPAAQAPPAPAEPQAPAAPVGSEQPTTVVPLRPAPTEEHVGAHRRSDSEQPPTAPPTFTPPPFDTPSAPSGNRKLVTWYAAACAALLAVLILVVVYGVFLNDADDVDMDASGPGTTTAEASETPTTTGDSGWGESSETATESPTTVAETGDATDGSMSFTVHGVEVGTTVVSSDAPIEKTAAGEYIVVHMTVTNTGAEPATFLGTYQRLLAGGITYYIDDEATFYVGGGLAELPPGGSADVSVAFDVPTGTQAEAIVLHADPMGPGVQVSLS